MKCAEQNHIPGYHLVPFCIVFLVPMFFGNQGRDNDYFLAIAYLAMPLNLVRGPKKLIASAPAIATISDLLLKSRPLLQIMTDLSEIDLTCLKLISIRAVSISDKTFSISDRQVSISKTGGLDYRQRGVKFCSAYFFLDSDDYRIDQCYSQYSTIIIKDW